MKICSVILVMFERIRYSGKKHNTYGPKTKKRYTLWQLWNKKRLSFLWALTSCLVFIVNSLSFSFFRFRCHAIVSVSVILLRFMFARVISERHKVIAHIHHVWFAIFLFTCFFCKSIINRKRYCYCCCVCTVWHFCTSLSIKYHS